MLIIQAQYILLNKQAAQNITCPMFKGELNKNSKDLFITSYFSEDNFGIRHFST
jgi:hypothetical protein